MTYTSPSPLILKLFFVCIYLFSGACSAMVPVQVIAENRVKLEQFQMGYFVDKSEQMPFEEVRQQAFQVSSNGVSLGTASKTTWVKIELENAKSTPIKLYLHHPYAYHNSKIELYEVVDGELTRARLLDMDDKTTQQWMYRGSAVFDFTLAAQQHKTLFVKSLAFSHQWFVLNLYDEDHSKRELLGQYTDIALLVGMILALIVYNLLLFLSSRLREHFFYACYLISGGFWIALSYGLLADLFNVYGSVTLKWHLSLVSMPIFILLFMVNIFETKRKYPIEHGALLSILTLLIFEFVYGLFDIVTALKYSSTLAAIMMVVSLSVTCSMLVRKHPIARFFLFGHGLFIFFSTLAVFFYKGKAEFNYINSHGVGIGIVLEALVLSLIMAYRIRTLEKLKATQADLQLLASTDPLTQLFNRRHFSLAANLLLEQAKQTGQPVSIAMIDIDHFKQINDTYGHALGDKSIKRVADVIRGQCRHEDILARYGGEEFVILMPDTVLHEGYVVAERIRQALEKMTIQVDRDQSVSCTISVGLAEVDADAPDLQNTIDHADQALYSAKNNGRNQSQLYSLA
ncbi:diguanylate cyclase [Amphritea sp. 1_MG-2023]|uniref:sensor domain-containing diguanylate cyclase n=1 Tax=Amphritea sp. 1_MG-2023 TaxID=3062670 RepID=UPI0026E12435|nr:diguanylate cyclase [Amphritea sp. 1_MG-2023]MDO6563617.1 diguanylate cyclase [Amphritea sp. 1_MG-2023]